MSSKTSSGVSSLRNGEKNLRDNVPIRFNEWANASRLTPDETAPKSSFVKFSVLTSNHGIGGTGKSSASSLGTRASLKIAIVEDNPREVIQVWQSIFKELLPAMIDVNPITAVELFQAHLTGTALTEFEQISFDAAGKLYDNFISVEFNRLLDKYTTVDFRQCS